MQDVTTGGNQVEGTGIFPNYSLPVCVHLRSSPNKTFLKKQKIINPPNNNNNSSHLSGV